MQSLRALGSRERVRACPSGAGAVVGGLKIGLLLAIESPRFRPAFDCTLHLLLTLSDLRIIALCTKPPRPLVGDGDRAPPKMLAERFSVDSASAAVWTSDGLESLASDNGFGPGAERPAGRSTLGLCKGFTSNLEF